MAGVDDLGLRVDQLSTGDGPQVSGPIHAILLACTGRRTALPQLSGEGTRDLTARLSSPQRR